MIVAATPLVLVRGLQIVLEGKAATPLLHDLSFDLNPGERLAIVGESGSGKTLAARALLGLLSPGVRRVAGTMTFDGVALETASEATLRSIRGAGIGMVFQEPMASLNPALKIGRQLCEGLRLHRQVSASEARMHAIAMLERVRMTDPAGCLDRFPHQFSGGMRQRIMLASVLLLRPRLLIADEPTTALDTLSQREVLELMMELTREAGTALLLITHDLGLVAQYTDRVVVMEKGHLIEQGSTADVLHHPAQPYTAKLVGSLPRRDPARPDVPVDATELLTLDKVSVCYPGKGGLLRRGTPRTVLDGVSLQVRSGEIVALVGSSGSGKTTLSRAALGLVRPSEGIVAFDSANVASMGKGALRSFRRDAQLVFQDPFSSLDPRLHVHQIVGATLKHVPNLGASERRARVDQALDEVGLAGYGMRLPHQMSGGQRQRVAIARAIVTRPRLVVADEPVSALDLTVQLQVLELFQRLQREYGFACLFVTHDLSVVHQVADRVVVLHQGAIVEEGTVHAVLGAPQHDYTRALIAATPALALTTNGGMHF